MSTTTMSAADDNSHLMNYLVRMITQLRREFGRSLDVTQFLHDFTCAREVMEQALSSQDPRLREYATYVQQRFTVTVWLTLRQRRPAQAPLRPPSRPRPAARR
ncbi:MAG: hypothetical protein H7Y33_04345, partial [Cytophagales bacterium]|nr:hypothetical protein [Rhizobacter sp.]